MRNSGIISTLISACFVMLFLFAGTGYNVVKHCCNDCPEKSGKLIYQHHCHDSHAVIAQAAFCCSMSTRQVPERNMYLQLSLNLTSLCSLDGKCEIKRIYLDEFAIPQKISVPIYHTDLISYAFRIYSECSFFDKFLIQPHSDIFHDFVLPDGRSILSHKAVLLI